MTIDTFDKMNGKDYKNLCERCIPLIRSTGEYIAAQLGSVSAEQIETKEKNSLVSYVDKTAEEMLVQGLRSLLPEAGFLTEEGTVKQGGSNSLWIIDPLDGTSNFLHGIPHFAVSVGLEIDGVLCVGLVLDVMREECFYAWKGGGAYLNGKPIRCSNTPVLDDAIIGTGFPYAVDEITPLILSLEAIIRSSRGVRRLGAAALDLAYVASGRLDAYYETGLNAWDVAGGAVIIEEAGGKVSDFFGGQNHLFGGKIIAANPLIINGISQILSSHF